MLYKWRLQDYSLCFFVCLFRNDYFLQISWILVFLYNVSMLCHALPDRTNIQNEWDSQFRLKLARIKIYVHEHPFVIGIDFKDPYFMVYQLYVRWIWKLVWLDQKKMSFTYFRLLALFVVFVWSSLGWSCLWWWHYHLHSLSIKGTSLISLALRFMILYFLMFLGVSVSFLCFKIRFRINLSLYRHFICFSLSSAFFPTRQCTFWSWDLAFSKICELHVRGASPNLGQHCSSLAG